MRPSRTRPAKHLTTLVVASALGLAACTGGSTDPDATPTPTADPGPQPEDVVATAVIPEAGMDLEVRGHPLVRAGDHVVRTVTSCRPRHLRTSCTFVASA